jgi:hypothetical protein
MAGRPRAGRPERQYVSGYGQLPQETMVGLKTLRARLPSRTCSYSGFRHLLAHGRVTPQWGPESGLACFSSPANRVTSQKEQMGVCASLSSAVKAKHAGSVATSASTLRDAKLWGSLSREPIYTRLCNGGIYPRTLDRMFLRSMLKGDFPRKQCGFILLYGPRWPGAIQPQP